MNVAGDVEKIDAKIQGNFANNLLKVLAKEFPDGNVKYFCEHESTVYNTTRVLTIAMHFDFNRHRSIEGYLDRDRFMQVIGGEINAAGLTGKVRVLLVTRPGKPKVLKYLIDDSDNPYFF